MAQARPPRRVIGKLEHFSEIATRWTGTDRAFAIAIAIVLVWAVLGPVFHLSDTWQLTINTSTTIVTFLMVFLIQRNQNKEALAIHLKLNEIVAALHGASNRLIEAEGFSEKDLETLQQHYKELAQLARSEADVTESHSVEEARERHTTKHGQGKRRAG
jgi:low affinity Fe/Cu permease